MTLYPRFNSSEKNKCIREMQHLRISMRNQGHGHYKDRWFAPRRDMYAQLKSYKIIRTKYKHWVVTTVCIIIIQEDRGISRIAKFTHVRHGITRARTVADSEYKGRNHKDAGLSWRICHKPYACECSMPALLLRTTQANLDKRRSMPKSSQHQKRKKNERKKRRTA